MCCSACRWDCCHDGEISGLINMSKYSYYTDGAATMKQENGKYVREAGGWAFVLLIDGCEDSIRFGGCPMTTNNEMELYAMYASMKDFLLKSQSGDIIEIFSDSAYCINIFTQWATGWQKRGWKKSDNKPIQNLKIIKSIWDLMGEIRNNSCILNFIKVKGHSSNKYNDEADKLAVDAKIDAFKTGKTTYFDENDGLLGKKYKYAD